MKNFIKFAGIIAVLIVIGLVLWGCEEPKGYSGPDYGTVRIIGIAQVGEKLTADLGNYSYSQAVNYEWKRSGTTTIGNSSSYIIQESDVGSTITITVSQGYRYREVTSSPTSVVINYTAGLLFTIINNNTAYSVSKGTATASFIRIPAVHNDLPVVEIADSGFSSYSNMKGIIIPSGVTRIGNYAFFNCSNLNSVLIPAGVTSIGNFAFHDCTVLSTIFYGGESGSYWTAVTVGSSNSPLLEAILYFFSENYPSGTENTYWRFEGSLPVNWPTPGLIFTIDTSGYSGYKVSKGTAIADEIIIPAMYEGLPVTRIADNGFEEYENLKKITIPDSVRSIGSSAFSECTGLTSITIPNSVTSIGEWAFSGCTGLTSITIPNSVTSIGEGVFSECRGLTSITIPNSVTSIDRYAFYYCTSLTSITIPNSVTSIGRYAFYYCTSLTSITIPNSVTSIGGNAFYYTRLWSNAINNSAVYIDNWLIGYKGTINGDIIINTGTVGISGYAFGYLPSLTSITIPNSVRYIGDSAFYGCTGLMSITIPDSVEYIGYSTFEGCTSLKNISVNFSNRYYSSIGGVLYDRNRTQLIFVPQAISGSFTIPNGLTEFWFINCTNLTSITIPSSITYIYLEGCTSLTNINVNTSNQYYSSQNGILYDKNKTEILFVPLAISGSITIPSSMTEIYSGVFAGCTGLTSITIPNSVTSIGSYAFSGCTGLTKVTIGTITEWNFYNWSFPGNLRDVYFAAGGGAGTYITTNPGEDAMWVKQ